MNIAAQNQDPQQSAPLPERPHLPAQVLKLLAVTSIAAVGASELPASPVNPVGTEAAIAKGPGRPHGITVGDGNQHPKHPHKHGGRPHGITVGERPEGKGHHKHRSHDQTKVIIGYYE